MGGQIDDSLADIRDKIKKMFRVQHHLIFIQQQYDKHIDSIRNDQSELLSILSELKDRYSECNEILSNMRDVEVWLITNIANTIAERAEKIDSMNRRIKTMTDSDSKKQEYVSLVASTKTFILSLQSLIREIQTKSNQKEVEVEALKTSIISTQKQNLVLIEASKVSYEKVLCRLFELQNHYELPSMMESETDSNGQCNAIISSLNIYLTKTDCSIYYHRSMELYQSQIIYSEEGTKCFYNTLVFMMNTVIIDCMLLHQYITTNTQNNHCDDDDDMPLSEGPMLNQMSSHEHDDSLNIIHGLFDPISLEKEREYNVNDPNKLLSQILIDNEIDANFECVELMKDLKNKNKKYALWKKIKIVSRFGHIMPMREATIQYLAQFVCIKYKDEILRMRNDKDKIKEFARTYCLMLISEIIFSKNSPNGLIKSIKRMTKENDIKSANKKCIYKMAALILKNVYNISIAYPL